MRASASERVILTRARARSGAADGIAGHALLVDGRRAQDDLGSKLPVGPMTHEQRRRRAPYRH